MSYNKRLVTLTGGCYGGGCLFVTFKDSLEEVCVDFLRDTMELIDTQEGVVVRVYRVEGFGTSVIEFTFYGSLSGFSEILNKMGVMLVETSCYFDMFEIVYN